MCVRVLALECREQLLRKEAQRKQLQQALRRAQLAAKALRRLREQLTSLEAGRPLAVLSGAPRPAQQPESDEVGGTE